MIDKTTGAWYCGWVEPRYKEAIDATMLAYPHVKYSGRVNHEGWLELVVPTGLCDLFDFHILYFELRKSLEPPLSPELKAKIEQRNAERKRRREMDAMKVVDHGYYAGD